MTENPDRVLSLDELKDEYRRMPVRKSEVVFRGHVWDVVSEDADLGEAGVVTREFVKHPGAVAVLALRGEAGYEEALVIRQYRHPIGAFEWEIPAGLLDVDGEAPDVAAIRELYEEADLRAEKVDLLIDYASSPGGLSEQLRVFVAREVTAVEDSEVFEREDEEADLQTAWVKLDDVVKAGLAGQIHNPTLLMSAFAATAARASNWSTLRASDAPWPEHPAFNGSDDQSRK